MSVEVVHIQGEEATVDIFYTHSVFMCGAEEGFAVPLSLTQERFCHCHETHDVARSCQPHTSTADFTLSLQESVSVSWGVEVH